MGVSPCGLLATSLDDALGKAYRVTAITHSHDDAIIPAGIDQNPCAQSRMPMDMMVHGWSMSLFQASQQSATISSYELKILFDNQLSRMNCQTFSTGFSSGDRGGSGSRVMLSGMSSFGDMCHPAWSMITTA